MKKTGRLQVDIRGVRSGTVQIKRAGTTRIITVHKDTTMRLPAGKYRIKSMPVIQGGWQYVTKKRHWRTVRVRKGKHRIVTAQYRPVPIPWDVPPIGEFTTMLTLVNDIRRGHGLKPVGYNIDLALAAQRFADDMAAHGYFSHIGFDGSTFKDRIKATPFRGKPAGENIASGFTTALATFDGWMRSEHHRLNILNSEFNLVGFGYAVNTEGQPIWVQDFGYDPGL